MVKLNRRLKLLILITVFTTVGWFCLQPLVKINTNEIYMTLPAENHKFTATELGDFLNLWYQLRQKNYLKKKLEQFSLQNTDHYPWTIVKWLELKGWSAERFFYDEQHLKDILSCVNLKINLNTNIEVSKKTNINLKDIVSSQRRGLQACLFDEEELELIELNRQQIISVFTE